MKNTFFLTVLASAGLSILSGCGKKSDPTPTPVAAGTSYQVEYRVSSATATTATYFAYKNDTGGTTTLATLALPGSVTFKRTMKTGDNVGFLAGLPSGSATNSEITGVILLNGQAVATSTGRGADAEANVVYVIR